MITLLTGRSEKGIKFSMSGTLNLGKFCSPLFEHRYTADQQAPPENLHTSLEFKKQTILFCIIMIIFHKQDYIL